jgi:hypothetical protein
MQMYNIMESFADKTSPYSRSFRTANLTDKRLHIRSLLHIWCKQIFIINKAIMGPSTQQIFSSSDVTARKHTTLTTIRDYLPYIFISPINCMYALNYVYMRTLYTNGINARNFANNVWLCSVGREASCYIPFMTSSCDIKNCGPGFDCQLLRVPCAVPCGLQAVCVPVKNKGSYGNSYFRHSPPFAGRGDLWPCSKYSNSVQSRTNPVLTFTAGFFQIHFHIVFWQFVSRKHRSSFLLVHCLKFSTHFGFLCMPHITLSYLILLITTIQGSWINRM